MEDHQTHTVTITISGNYHHGPKEHSSVTVLGDGGMQHMEQAFQAALMAAGFKPTEIEGFFKSSN